MPRLRYDGTKPFHADSLYGTGKVWMGAGDVHVIDDADVAQAMVRNHPDIYAPVVEGDAPVRPERAMRGAPPAMADEEADEDEAAVDPNHPVLDSEMIRDGQTSVALRDATFTAIRAHVANVLNIRMLTPSRLDMIKAIIELREAEADAAEADAKDE